MANDNFGNSKLIWDTIVDLNDQEQTITREVLQDLTGLKLTTIDSQIKDLIEHGKLARVVPGVYRLVQIFAPARVMSKSIMPDGMIKLEIGSQMLTLTPKEDRTLAAIQAGVMGQYAAIEAGRQSTILATQLAEEVRKLSQKLAAVQTKVDQRQLELAPV